jgi:hypothetical protein
MSLLDLPTELICYITKFLSHGDKLSLRRTCLILWNIIDIDRLMILKYPILKEISIETWKHFVIFNNFKCIAYLDYRYDCIESDSNIHKLLMEYCPHDFLTYMVKKNITIERFLKIKPFTAIKYCESKDVLIILLLLSNIEVPKSAIIDNISIIRSRIISEDNKYILDMFMILFNIDIQEIFPTSEILRDLIGEYSINIFRYICTDTNMPNLTILGAIKRTEYVFKNIQESKNIVELLNKESTPKYKYFSEHIIQQIVDVIMCDDNVELLKSIQKKYYLPINTMFPSWEHVTDVINSGAINVFRYIVRDDFNRSLSDTRILSAILGYYVKDH